MIRDGRLRNPRPTRQTGSSLHPLLRAFTARHIPLHIHAFLLSQPLSYIIVYDVRLLTVRLRLLLPIHAVTVGYNARAEATGLGSTIAPTANTVGRHIGDL